MSPLPSVTLVRFLADENVESHVVETLIRRVPSVDIVSVHDVRLAAKDDRSILEWAASNERIVVTRDVSSMRAYADARVEAGLPMPGLVLIPSTESIGEILENLEDMALLSMAGEWEGQVIARRVSAPGGSTILTLDGLSAW